MKTIVRIGLAAVLVVLGFLAAAPRALGGHMTYVAVSGHSMEPTFRQGDLVVARARTHYAPGDVAAYRVPVGQPGAGHLVIHRIIAVNGERVRFQGDNRVTPDGWDLHQRDVVGAAVVVLPKGGTVMGVILSPLVLAALATVIMLWIVLPMVFRPEEPQGGVESSSPDHTVTA